MRMRCLAVALVVGIALLAPRCAWSQATPAGTGSVEGRVEAGPGGAPVSGVRVELSGGGQLRAAQTSPDGRFLFQAIPSGTYELRVHLSGDTVTRAVQVTAGSATAVRVDASQLVVSLSPLLAVTQPLSTRPGETEFGVRIGPQALRRLPMAYDPAAMAALAPGVSGDRIWGGASQEANLYQLDGVTLTHPGTGGYLVPLSPSWVESVEVRGLGAGADVGNFQGGVVNLVTRSGSNAVRTTARSSVESVELNASNDVVNEISRERVMRADLEADWSGPLRRDRLFLFAGGHVLRDEYRARSHLPGLAAQHLPHHEERTDVRGIARLTWTPGPHDRLDGSLVLSRSQASNWALTGYEAEGAAPDYRAPGHMLMLGWRRLSGSATQLDVRASRAGLQEHWTAPAGSDRPGVRMFFHGDPPSPAFGNAPFEVERRPSLTTLAATVSHAATALGMRHELQAGAELSGGEWVDRRTRTGGLTWRPPQQSTTDPANPATWAFGGIIPSDWGGEVDLHARTRTGALFVQDRLTVHPRWWLNGGIRATAWRGDLLPGGVASDRIRAIDTGAWEPRLGTVVDVTGNGSLLLKGHWGRYYQNLLAPMFDRVEGGNVFSDRELWYYRGAPPTDPRTTFSRAQRDAMQDAPPGEPGFSLYETVRLNEVGPVADDYRQPHMDQWLAGVEAGWGGMLRFEAVFIHRRNQNLVALMDRNLDTNYHVYRDVAVHDWNGDPVLLNGEHVIIPEIYIRYSSILRQLVNISNQSSALMPPGFSLADIGQIEPEVHDYVLGNAPDAQRTLRQLQLSAHLARPAWGAWASVVLSSLRGNLDSVTGYEAGSGYDRFWELGAGPYVRPNESVRADGRLPGVHPIELKTALHGRLPWGFSGGAILEARRGERFTPWLTLSSLGHNLYTDGQQIPGELIGDVAGQRVMVAERGSAHYADRVSLDLRLERELPVPGGDWRVSADVFNLWNAASATRINPSINFVTTATASPFFRVQEPAVYRAVWERQPPRTLRLGLSRSSGAPR